jgi:hypothetical protein
MPQFLILARDEPSQFTELSPEEMQRVIQKYVAWGDRITKAGKMGDHNKLRDGEGRVVRGGGGKVSVTDGPFVETKEVVGGYWVVTAADFEEAVKLASDSPHLEVGSLEIRQIETL